jgi:hypothetical protein
VKEVRRTTLHTPVVLMGRDRAVPVHGEPRCGARIAPGATTAINAGVTCEACLKLMAKGEGK